VLPVPTTADLAVFTGRPAQSFTPFSDEALAQATLMFSIVTQLTAMPDDPDKVLLANNAILEMADKLYLEQPFAVVKAGPFQAETVGSYSYSRGLNAARTSIAGLKLAGDLGTGLFWWDIAVEQLAMPAASIVGSGSVQVLPDGLRRAPDGHWVVRNAAEVDDVNGGIPYVRIS